MFKKTFAIMFLIALLISTNSAKAAIIKVINFDDVKVSSSLAPITNQYPGFTWTNFGIINPAGFGNPELKISSGPNAGFNMSGLQASFSREGGLNLKSFDIAAWYRGAFNLKVSYYGKYNHIGDDVFSLKLNESTHYVVNKNDVQRVEFVAVDENGNPLSGKWFTIDDINFIPIPEPSSLLMGIFGMSSLLGLKRKLV